MKRKALQRLSHNLSSLINNGIHQKNTQFPHAYFVCRIDHPHRSELHASPHIHIWIGHNHIWIYMDKTIWECGLYVG